MGVIPRLINSKKSNMKKTTHYTDGYGGSYNYKTYCGKEIKSHNDTDDASVDPTAVTCEKCRKSREWSTDYSDYLNTDTSIRRRIYLESDILHASELRSAQREVKDLCDEKKEPYVRRVFSDVIDYAWHDLEKTWAAVKIADEIYSDSSLVPLCGGSYMGAPVIFNGMRKKAIEENVTGKDVYILNFLSNIHWGMIDIPLMKKAFKNNNLFMYNEERDIVKVDVSKIKK